MGTSCWELDDGSSLTDTSGVRSGLTSSAAIGSSLMTGIEIFSSGSDASFLIIGCSSFTNTGHASSFDSTFSLVSGSSFGVVVLSTGSLFFDFSLDFFSLLSVLLVLFLDAFLCDHTGSHSTSTSSANLLYTGTITFCLRGMVRLKARLGGGGVLSFFLFQQTWCWFKRGWRLGRISCEVLRCSTWHWEIFC